MKLTKATHVGECQLCGHIQKLPGGALSIHGYTKRWGFFSGSCPGSRHLPFELDASLLDGTATRNEKEAVLLLARAERYRKQTEEVAVYHYVRAVSCGEKSGYRTTFVPRDQFSVEGIYMSFPFAGKVIIAQHAVYARALSTDDIVIEAMNNRWADSLVVSAANHKEYARWLRERRAEWVLRELKPVQ